MAAGNKHLGYKETLNELEVKSPGTKRDFYFGFLARAAESFRDGDGDERPGLGTCRTCGAPSTNEECAFCHLVGRTAGAEPVTLTIKARR